MSFLAFKTCPIHEKLALPFPQPHVPVLEPKESMSSICENPHFALLSGTGEHELAGDLPPHSQYFGSQCSFLQASLVGEQEAED